MCFVVKVFQNDKPCLFHRCERAERFLVSLTNKVLWKLELMFPNMSLPTMVAIVGRMSAPQRTLVAETGSVRGWVSAGMREP